MIGQVDDGFVLLSGDASLSLPITGDDEALLPLVGLPGTQVFGLWDGRYLSPQSAMTPIGLWQEG